MGRWILYVLLRRCSCIVFVYVVVLSISHHYIFLFLGDRMDYNINNLIRDEFKKDLEAWSGGRPKLKENLEEALEAMIIIMDDKPKRDRYEDIMDEEWLEAFLILHYHTLVGSGELSPLTINPDVVGRRRKVKAVVEEENNRAYDLFLVDPHDIRNICKRAMLMTMYFMEERQNMKELFKDIESGEDNSGT